MEHCLILSLPRSGSTLLSAILDQRHGVISPPESSFPQILGEITPEERADPLRLAALYVASTYSGTPLSLAESQACMTGTDTEILTNIALALASKLGRDPGKVRMAIWKSTRTVSFMDVINRDSGKIVILRRHPLNVFESQFRVHFGLNNRKPFRFASFRESYESAFASCPKDRTFELNYEEIPAKLPELLGFLGIAESGVWEEGVSSLKHVAENRPWLSQILGDFDNTDEEKRGRLDPKQSSGLISAMRITRLLRPLFPPLRKHYDRSSLADIRRNAGKLLRAHQENTPS